MKEFSGHKEMRNIKAEISENVLLWDKLKNLRKPIVLYGMGNGAEKILDYAESESIKISDIFASDGFVRGHSFRGYKVKKLSEIAEIYDDFIILAAFATREKSVIDRIFALDEKYELYAPDISMFEDKSYNGECNYLVHFLKDADSYSQAYNLLADEKSRQVFRNAINFKISGKIKYIREAETPKQEALDVLRIRESQGLHYIDIGAYDGDTIAELNSYLADAGKNIGKITAFEPDKKNFIKLQKNLESSNLLDRCELYNTAAWNQKQYIYFRQKAGRHSAVEHIQGVPSDSRFDTTKKINLIEADSLDNILAANLKCGETTMFIKYDVEGCEYEAVSGSAETIKKYQPALAVSLYHKNEDLFRIPLLINKINPSYKFYLRKHKYIPFWDLNLYAL